MPGSGAVRPGGQVKRMMAWLIAGVIAMNLVLIACSALTLGRSRQLAETQAGQWTRSLSMAIEKELTGIVHMADFALRSVIDEVVRQRAAGGVDAAHLGAFIERLGRRVPFIDGIRVTDADGVLVHGTGVVPERRVDVSDRAHFRALREARHDTLEFSPLQQSRANGRWVLVLARRIAVEGRFEGMAFTPIAVDDLSASFARYAIPRGSAITLRDRDLRIAARYPPATTRDGGGPQQVDIGRSLAQLLASGADEGTVREVSPVDGIKRIRSFRRVSGTPFLLLVGRAESEYLAAWRSERKRAILIVAAFLLMSTLTASMLSWYWRRLESALEAEKRMALTDFLTGLANRRAFIDAIDREILRARRYASTFSVLMIDIDHFKRINDTHGHEVGDATLRALAERARSVLREVDLVARWGGEEFVVLLPDTDSTNAGEAAERLRASVESSELLRDGPAIHATISIGHATLESETETVDGLIQRADRALHRAKSLGRNCVSK